MVEVDLSDELIDLIGKDVLASALGFDATRVTASHLPHPGCERRVSVNLLHRNLFHIVSLLGRHRLSGAGLPAVGGGATARQMRTAATQT